MKISLKWVQDFVDIQDYFKKPETLAEILTRAGLEVEEIQNRSKDFDHVVVGLILEKDKHPQADKLSLCRVTTGEGVVHQIVCGAQNHKANDRVIVALPGALLPGNFAIKQSVIRGVESAGMLCSLKELGLAKESEGIAILPEDAPLGKPYAEYAGYDDITFELKVTPNRADCLSHYGLAREIACLLDRPLKALQPEPPLQAGESKEHIGLEVKATDLCPRYMARYFQNVKVGESPAWLKKRLESVGLNSINNIVDVTNYVMMELGQPLHAFDADQIQGKKITVDRADAGQPFVTLDGTTLPLTGEELMIKDQKGGVCIAGVIGGKNSGVTPETKNIFLEAAYFIPQSARKSSRAHGLNTDSGYRFSRGVDPEGTPRALQRATELLLKVAGGEALKGIHDFYPAPLQKSPVEISIRTVSDRLGYEAKASLFESFMNRLGCAVESRGEGTFKVLPPSFRFDLEIDMDLVEEYARLNGYEYIPEALPVLNLAPTSHDANYVLSQKLSAGLRAFGFHQASNLAFVSRTSEQNFLKSAAHLSGSGLATSEQPVGVLNPLNEEMNVLRRSLSFSLYKNVLVNFHQGNESGRLFEIGKTFSLEGHEKYREYFRLGIAAWGQPVGLWAQAEGVPLIFSVKTAIENILAQFGIRSYEWVTFAGKGEIPEFLHRGQAAILMAEGKRLGFLGSLHPLLSEENKIRGDVVLCELDLETLFQGQPRSKRFESLSRFPKVERDLALVMPLALHVSDVSREIKKAAGPMLTELKVFDVYKGDKLDKGQKSVAFRLVFQDKAGTLQDVVVHESIEKVLKSLAQKFQISVR